METMMKRFQTVMGWTDEEVQAFVQEIAQSVAERNQAKDIPTSYEKLEIMVTNLVSDMGFSTRLIGYSYLKTAIILMMKDKNHYRNRIGSKLCQRIADMHDTTPGCVDHAIIRSIEEAYENTDNKLLYDVVGADFVGRPTKAQFLYGCVDYLERKLKEDSCK